MKRVCLIAVLFMCSSLVFSQNAGNDQDGSQQGQNPGGLRGNLGVQNQTTGGLRGNLGTQGQNSGGLRNNLGTQGQNPSGLRDNLGNQGQNRGGLRDNLGNQGQNPSGLSDNLGNPGTNSAPGPRGIINQDSMANQVSQDNQRNINQRNRDNQRTQDYEDYHDYPIVTPPVTPPVDPPIDPPDDPGEEEPPSRVEGDPHRIDGVPTEGGGGRGIPIIGSDGPTTKEGGERKEGSEPVRIGSPAAALRVQLGNLGNPGTNAPPVGLNDRASTRQR